MRKVLMIAALAAGMTIGTANAQGFDSSNLYAGGGFGHNSWSGWDNAFGFQFFGGYQLDMVDIDPAGLSVEVGYMTTGDFSRTYWHDFSADGVWATAVVDYALTPEWTAIGRAGLDFGDDDGLMFGAGIGYTLSPEIELRGEYVIRNHINSLQGNIVYYFQ